MKLITSIGLAVAMLLMTSLAAAAVSDSEFEQMRAEFRALAERMATLEAENAELRAASQQTIQEIDLNRQAVASVKQQSAPASWTDTVRIKGDFRYRLESIDEEGKQIRDRNRIRARAAIIADLDDNVEVGLGFASGGDDPVSTNQTLGGGGSTKDLRLDLAYFNWAATQDLNLVGGKFKNMWHRPQKNGLMWDGDWNPEGFGLAWTPGSFFVSGTGTFLESDSKAENTEFSYGFQGGFDGNVGSAKLVTGLGYYFIETRDKSPFFGSADDFFGNSFTCADPVAGTDCAYLYDFKIVQAFGDLSMNVGDMPLSVFVDYVRNTDADEFDTGYAVGVKLGKTSTRGTWDLAYIWQDLEANAVLGLLTDSDFGGGGTDAKGHIFKGGYGINKKWNIGVTYFRNEIGANAGDERDYERIIFDTKFKY
jgi:hypothetical protein